MAQEPSRQFFDQRHRCVRRTLLDAVDEVDKAVEAGVAKFILRPTARGDDDMAQTRRLIDEVLTLVAARRPKPARRQAAE
jgi:hypothetical protein